MTEIIKHQPLPVLVDARNKILALIEQTRANLDEISAIAESILGDNYFYIMDRGRFPEQEEAIKKVDKRFWNFILESSRLSNAMTSGARAEMAKKLESDPPAFELSELEKFAQFFQQYYGDNAMQTIREVYRKLIGCRYRSADWNIKKADNLRKVERTFRIWGPIEWWLGEFRYRDWKTNDFDYEDMLTVCYLLDAKGRPDYNKKFYVLAREQLKVSDTVTTPYFTIKAFKNGNQLVKWTRLDILNDFNKYGGEDGNALPDALRKKYKPEHFEKCHA